LLQSIFTSQTKEIKINMRQNRLLSLSVSVVLLVVTLLPSVILAQGVLPPAPYNTRQSAGVLGGNQSVTSILFRVLDILLMFAGLVAVIFVIVGGYRYVTAGGNEEAVESAKHTILNAIIGVAVIILSYAILRVVQNAALGTV
jgi:hypothetical protein